MEGTGRSKVFISYSRADLAFTDELAAALGTFADFDVLLDRVGIGHGEEWKERLGRLIVECDTMVFVLSPDSVSSEVCAWEIEEARRLCKRIIPILWRTVDFAKVPAGLSAINAVPFDGERAVGGLPKLVTALKNDLAWLREHTRLGERAVEWEQSGHTTAYLLRGAALEAAREWLAAKPSNSPAVTELQHAFIQASEEDESRLLSDERKRSDELEKAKATAEAERDAAETARINEANAARRVVRTRTAGLIVALVLFVAASGAGLLALQKSREERKAAEGAQQATERAEQEAKRAESAAADAKAQRDAALLTQSRFLARAAREHLTQGDAANAIGLARAALPRDLAAPDRPFAIEPAQVVFDAYGKLRELATLRGHTVGLKGALALADDRILTWGRDGTIRWWRIDGTLLKTVLAHEHPTKPDAEEDTGVHGVLRLEDGRLLSWGIDTTAKLWKHDGTFIEAFLREADWIRIERLKDGRIAARIGNEYRIWSAGLEPLLVLRSLLNWMKGATLLNDGRFMTWQQGFSREAGRQADNVILWNTDGTPGPVLEGHERRIRGGIELADGRIVTMENGPSLRIWSGDGKLETVIEKAHKHIPPWDAFAFPLRDGRFLTWGQEAYGDHVWWARLWNAGGESVALIEASDQQLHGFELADGRLLLGTHSRTPTIWHTDGTRGPVLRGHEEPARGAAQWPDGRIATLGSDHTARIWSQDGAPMRVLRGHEGSVSGVNPLSGERYLTWSFSDRTARIWREEPEPRGLLRPEGGNVKTVQQLASGSIAVRTDAGLVALYGSDLKPGPSLRNGERDVIAVVEMPDGRLLTQGGNYSDRQPGPALQMWSAAGEPVADLAGPNTEFLHIALTPSGRILGFDRTGEVWIWRTDGQLEDRRRGTETSQFYRIFPLRSGRFVTSGDDNRLQIWNAEGEPGKVLDKSERGPAKELVSFGDGRFLMISWNEPPQIWEANGDRGPPLELGESLRVMDTIPLRGGTILLKQPNRSPVIVNSDGSFHQMPLQPGPGGGFQRHKVFSLADGRLLVSTPDQGTRVWSPDGKPGLRILDSAISGARLLSDGSFLVWSSDRNDLRIVDSDGQPGPLLRGHESEIRQALQLADGRVLSWAEDASVRVWPGSIGQAIAWADEVISRLRPLTLAERCDHYLEPPVACEGVGKP